MCVITERDFTYLTKGKVKGKVEITDKSPKEIFEFYKDSISKGFNILPKKVFLEKNGLVKYIDITEENFVKVGLSVVAESHDGWKELKLN